MPRRQSLKKVGEIWWVQLYDTTRTEILGTRPAVIFAINSHPKLYTIIPLTSNLDAKKLPNTYQITSTEQNKLTNNSVALIFQIRSLHPERFLRKVGDLEKDKFHRLKMLVRSYLNFD